MRSRRVLLTGSSLSSRLAQWSAPSIIKSVQRSTIAITGGTATATATITAVDPSNSRLVYLAVTSTDANAYTQYGWCGLTFTNATTITATRTSTLNTCTVSFEVIEYVPGVIKSVQRGTVSGGSTATITAITTTKASLAYLGHTGNSVSYEPTLCESNLVLTNATTVTSNQVNTGNPITSYFEVVEFF